MKNSAMQNAIATLEKSLVVSYKVKHTFTHNLEIPFLDVYPRNKKHIHTKILYKNVYSSSTHYSQKKKTNKQKKKQPKCTSVGEWISKL